MDENKTLATEQELDEPVSRENLRSIRGLFKRNLKSYKEKDPSVSDEEWLYELFRRELPEEDEEQHKADAREIVASIHCYDDNLKSVNEAAEHGTSKERWLADHLQEASVGMSVLEFGKQMQKLDDVLYAKNMELANALTVSSGGEVRINQNPNLDGIMAEHLLAETANISSSIQGSNIRVDVLSSHNANSVDLRAWDLDTGKYQNYQAKFGKDAKATINLLRGGDYRNQRIIVPSDQLEEVRAYFAKEGSAKTITDRIQMGDVEGMAFTKEEVKRLQEVAQREGVPTEMDYSYFQTEELAMSVAKNSATMALQASAITTGITLISKLAQDEPIEADEMVEVALKSGADASLKTVTAGTLQIVIRKGLIPFIAKTTPAGVIANIACVGIENIKILTKVASGELSVIKGIDRMGRVSVSMIAGLAAMAKGAAIGAGLVAGVSVIGVPLAVATGLVGGMVGYFAGAKVGECAYNAAKTISSSAKSMAKSAVNAVKRAGRAVANKLGIGRKIGRSRWA